MPWSAPPSFIDKDDGCVKCDKVNAVSTTCRRRFSIIQSFHDCGGRNCLGWEALLGVQLSFSSLPQRHRFRSSFYKPVSAGFGNGPASRPGSKVQAVWYGMKWYVMVRPCMVLHRPRPALFSRQTIFFSQKPMVRDSTDGKEQS
jgi:hypothetical protein